MLRRRIGDWDPVKRLSLPECAECTAFWTSGGRRFDPAETNANDQSVQLDGNTASVDVRLAGVVDAASPDVRPEQWVDELQLAYQDEAWKVKSIEIKQ